MKGYITREIDTPGVSYNYDLLPLIDNFTIRQFCDDVPRKQDEMTDISGVLVITPKQYILGYTRDYGLSTHLIGYARVNKDIHGGGKINNDDDLQYYYNDCRKSYITGRLGADVRLKHGFLGYEYNLRINFPADMTWELYDSFFNFYRDHNEEIKELNALYGFTVSCCIIDEEGVKNIKSFPNLDPILTYLNVNSSFFGHSVDVKETILGGNARKRV